MDAPAMTYSHTWFQWQWKTIAGPRALAGLMAVPVNCEPAKPRLHVLSVPSYLTVPTPAMCIAALQACVIDPIYQAAIVSPTRQQHSKRATQNVQAKQQCAVDKYCAYKKACRSTDRLGVPAKTMANRAKPTANGPTTPKEGSPMATAYTVDTNTNVITVSHPNSIPAQCTTLLHIRAQKANLHDMLAKMPLES